MSTRKKLVGAASAALISAAMMIAPIGTAAAAPTPPPDQGLLGGAGSRTARSPSRPARLRGRPPSRPAAVGRRARALRARGRSPASTRSTRSGRPTMPPRSSAKPTPGSCSRRRPRRPSTVTVMMLARKGAADDVVAAVREAGGTVGSVTEKLGYVRATVPTDSRRRRWPRCRPSRRSTSNRTYRVPAPDLGTGVTADAVALGAGPSAPDASTPAANPYMPIDETGAASFVDGEPEVGRPRHRRRRAGHRRRRRPPGAADDDATASPRSSTGSPRPTRSRTATARGSRCRRAQSGPSFRYAGRRLDRARRRLPHRLLLRVLRRSDSDFAGDLNGNGDVWDAYGVLYEPSTHTIWVDADNDHDFTDAPAMAPYGVDHQVGHFGADDPATPENEQIPFVVRVPRRRRPLAPRQRRRRPAPSSTSASRPPSHGTHVAGIVAATSMFGGEMHGAAPGAQIVSVARLHVRRAAARRPRSPRA